LVLGVDGSWETTQDSSISILIMIEVHLHETALFVA
jgi:hypothetical protein